LPLTTLSEGDPVAYIRRRGAYAELQVVPVDAVVTLPDDVETRMAVAALLQGMTHTY
jgi:NADPH2:quinone reductase